MAETKDTPLGLLRRTGPASAELLDQDAGQVFGFNFAEWASAAPMLGQDGREIADEIFGESKGGGKR